jgi:NTP pyrophosphatase (non-canonical NTP hydrolase)
MLQPQTNRRHSAKIYVATVRTTACIMEKIGGVCMHEIISKLKSFRDARDWQQFHNPKDLAVSISIEAAELLEIFQWRSQDEKLDVHQRERLSSEIADVFLYLLLLSDAVGVDIEQAAYSKIAQNEKRFPPSNSKGIAKPKDQLEEI